MSDHVSNMIRIFSFGFLLKDYVTNEKLGAAFINTVA
jgi:hypothetical protein